MCSLGDSRNGDADPWERRSSARESDVVLEALRQRFLGGEIARTSSSIRWTFCSDSTTRNERE